MLAPLNSENILKNNIKAYLIPHAHLDHVTGLIMNASADIQKQFIHIDVLLKKYFSWQNWANFTY